MEIAAATFLKIDLRPLGKTRQRKCRRGLLDVRVAVGTKAAQLFHRVFALHWGRIAIATRRCCASGGFRVVLVAKDGRGTAVPEKNKNKNYGFKKTFLKHSFSKRGFFILFMCWIRDVFWLGPLALTVLGANPHLQSSTCVILKQGSDDIL